MTGRFTFRFLKLFTEMMLDESFGDEPSIRDYFMNNIADKGNDGIPTPIIEECHFVFIISCQIFNEIFFTFCEIKFYRIPTWN